MFCYFKTCWWLTGLSRFCDASHPPSRHTKYFNLKKPTREFATRNLVPLAGLYRPFSGNLSCGGSCGAMSSFTLGYLKAMVLLGSKRKKKKLISSSLWLSRGKNTCSVFIAAILDLLPKQIVVFPKRTKRSTCILFNIQWFIQSSTFSPTFNYSFNVQLFYILNFLEHSFFSGQWLS